MELCRESNADVLPNKIVDNKNFEVYLLFQMEIPFLLESNAEGEVGIPLGINIFLFPQPVNLVSTPVVQ